ncbi:hypothetical protein FNH09_37595 [Streptomyces adustus]|uniref:Uncharacterized protein n=1 Tax=Streptomyces adustus TaxID=1609272 RepID=A0A5N8VPQ9_9ACTN|nr:hypothetical protein [Streptomyces adustus]MPY36732.1 hypothetical protein [Streptomyces adustus]
MITETVVVIAKVLTDPNDQRPWQEKIEDCFPDGGEALSQTLLSLGDDFEAEKTKAWLEQFNGQTYQKFAEKLLGAAQYRLLIEAFKEDAAALVLALRRAARALMPFAIAWRDATTLVSQNQIKPASRAQLLTFNTVDLMVSLDKFMGEKLFASLPMSLTGATEADLASWSKDQVDDLVADFRALVTEASTRRVERANSALVRKIRGARDALRYSEDGVSQAANSLIELLDRIMREAFPPSVVLAWADENLPDEPEMTHINKQGVRQPTKRAEALCFVYGGGSVDALRIENQYDDGVGPSVFHDILARVLVSARNKLQKLKHTDGGTPEEREQLSSLLAALEGGLMLGLSIGGISADIPNAPELPAA